MEYGHGRIRNGVNPGSDPLAQSETQIEPTDRRSIVGACADPRPVPFRSEMGEIGSRRSGCKHILKATQ